MVDRKDINLQRSWWRTLTAPLREDHWRLPSSIGPI